MARDIEKSTCAESAPREVASVAPRVYFRQEARSLPRAVLTRRREDDAQGNESPLRQGPTNDL
jgi:hypothetical protein